MVDVLDCLRKYGQRLDLELAKETGLPLEAVRGQLTALAASGDIMMFRLTQFQNGKRIESWQCRVSGYAPPRVAGRSQNPGSCTDPTHRSSGRAATRLASLNA